MASGLKVVTQGDFGHGLVGVGGLALNGAVAFGTGFGVGEMYHRFGKKWYGKHAPKLAAAVGKAGALITMFFTGGDPSIVGGAFNAMGDAGIATIGLEYGLRHARTGSGKKAILWPKDKALPAGAEETALGAAPAGRGMTWAQVEELARSR